MRILSRTLKEIENAFIRAPIESGGIIGSREGIVCAFYFDEGDYHADCYIPSVIKLNAKIAEWAERGIRFCGVIHSHHNDCRYISETDKEYALAVRKSVGNILLYFPIVTLCDGEVVVTAYSVARTKLKKEKITVE